MKSSRLGLSSPDGVASCRKERMLLWVRFAPAVAVATLLGGCAFGLVNAVETHGGIHCDPSRNVCGYLRGDDVEVELWGLETCSLAKVDFGDGDSVTIPDIAFGRAGATQPSSVHHTYRGWPGPKTITAEGVTNCSGRVTRSIHVFTPQWASGGYWEDFMLAYAPGPTTCAPISGMPALRPNTIVNIMQDPSPLSVIDFGCPFCTFGIDGDPGPLAPSWFPFPGLRKYSLVLRVGAQQEQGANGASFRTRQTGPLEICVNDDVLSDNRGGWGIIISVDESNAR